MKTFFIIVIVIVLAGLGFYYLVYNNPAGTPSTSNLYTETPTPSTSPSTSTMNMPTATPTVSASSTPKSTATVKPSVTVDIKNFSFNPATLTIKKGTKVTWVNN